MPQLSKSKKINVNVRIRPLTEEENIRADTELALDIKSTDSASAANPATFGLSITTPSCGSDDEVETVQVLGGFTVPKSRPSKSKAYKGFRQIAAQDVDNVGFYDTSVKPLVEETLLGRTSFCFAYGQTGSGKTHTILGKTAAESKIPVRGMVEQAAKTLFDTIDELNASTPERQGGNQPSSSESVMLQARFYEIYNGELYDLLNENAKCFVREDVYGTIQIRGETSKEGHVQTSNCKVQYAHSYAELMDVIQGGLAVRRTGHNNIHAESSRSHAILELKITNGTLVAMGEQLDLLHSELTATGFTRDKLKEKLFLQSYVQDKHLGRWVLIEGAPQATQAETDLLLSLKNEMEAKENEIKLARKGLEAQKGQEVSSVGGAFVFVDLAGAEQASTVSDDGLEKTKSEQMECREINKSLSALKGVFRSMALGEASMRCYRQSKLTLALRDHFTASSPARTLMVATVSPSSAHYFKTKQTLQYAQLVALC